MNNKLFLLAILSLINTASYCQYEDQKTAYSKAIKAVEQGQKYENRFGSGFLASAALVATNHHLNKYAITNKGIHALYKVARPSLWICGLGLIGSYVYTNHNLARCDTIVENELKRLQSRKYEITDPACVRWVKLDTREKMIMQNGFNGFGE